MEVGPGTHESASSHVEQAETSDPFAVPTGLRADLFNWANALGSFHEEPLTASAFAGQQEPADLDGTTVVAWRPGTDMAFALKRLNK
jgi:hypothetical protein